MEDIIDEFGMGLLEMIGFAAIFYIFIACIEPGGLINDYVQIFMNSITG